MPNNNEFESGSLLGMARRNLIEIRRLEREEYVGYQNIVIMMPGKIIEFDFEIRTRITATKDGLIEKELYDKKIWGWRIKDALNFAGEKYQKQIYLAAEKGRSYRMRFGENTIETNVPSPFISQSNI